jgi:hypothetical protein
MLGSGGGGQLTEGHYLAPSDNGKCVGRLPDELLLADRIRAVAGRDWP